MRRLFRWVIVTLGIAALVSWLRKRREQPRVPSPEPTSDPVDELRRKLAESRAGADDLATPETPVGSVDERRAEVHAKGRSALSEMAPPEEG